MFGLDWVDALGAATVALAVGFALPQLLRLWHDGTAAGLSLAALGNGIVSEVAWTGYAIHLGDRWVLAATLVAAPGALAMLLLGWRAGADRAMSWLPIAWAAVIVAAVAVEVLTHRDVLAFVLGGSFLWSVVPAVTTAWRAPDVSGIAAVAWWVVLAEGVLWLGYGLMSGVWATVVSSMVCFAGAFGILGRLALERMPTLRAVVLSRSVVGWTAWDDAELDRLLDTA